MSLQSTPIGQRMHVGFFGLRNMGKSSLVNAVTGQDMAIVSDILGTTTDPVQKSMELLPLGPVVIIDTPGIDDDGSLGSERIKKTKQALRKCDVVVLVTEAGRALNTYEEKLLNLFKERKVPYVIARNKCDLLADGAFGVKYFKDNEILVSAQQHININELKELIANNAKSNEPPKQLIADLLEEKDIVILVVPIDDSAPKGRIILPQQMVLRDILDAHGVALVCKPQELSDMLAQLKTPPKIVITDSQVFGVVSKIVPVNIMLTSFSILMARYKGELSALAKGAETLSKLTGKSKVLISEGCTHHRQCEDIGTVKIPAWIREMTDENPEFHFTSGGDFPEDICDYDLIIHCGGCMLNDKEMAYRLTKAAYCGVPLVNYGIAIARIHGILERSLEPF